MRYLNIVFGTLGLFFISSILSGQSTQKKETYNYTKIYHPDENVDSVLSSLTQNARQQHKRIWLTVGGNWCIWCARFDLFLRKESELNNFANSQFIQYHLDYNTHNLKQVSIKNLHIPDTIDLPTFVILDTNGTVLTIQSASNFLQTYTYNASKVYKFLQSWSKESH